MAFKCGDCKLFKGAGQTCGDGITNRHPGTTSCVSGFKGPARLFPGKRCGGCLLFEGNKQKCGGERTGRGTDSSACDSYTPIE